MRVQSLRAYPVEVPVGDDVVLAPARGVIDVPDELGARLCEQPDNWAPADEKPKRGQKAADEEGDG